MAIKRCAPWAHNPIPITSRKCGLAIRKKIRRPKK